ncbi:MAG: hypothetical protein NC489_31855 [Ruminococcus flavefaciens]|nr:hypothetical protein [Ruminococcus flavefaciens]
MTGDTDQDYNKGDYMVVEPELAVIEFTSILAEDFNMVPTDYTRQMIQEKYIKTLLVCTWDGVYAYWYQPINSTNEYGFVGTPKIPYFYTDDAGRQYCLNLGLEKAYSDNGDTGNYKLNPYEVMAPGIPKDIQLTAINNQVAELLNYTLIQAYGGGNRTAYEIPALASDISGAQPVDRITVIGIVEGQAESASTVITAECIGGAQVIQADPMIGVRLRFANGTVGKVYAASSWWKAHGCPYGCSFADGASDVTQTSNEYFDTPFEAAENGYYDLLSTMEDGGP